MTTATSVDDMDDSLNTCTVELEMDSHHCSLHHGIISSTVVIVAVVMTSVKDM